MDSKNSIFDDLIFSEQSIAKEIDGANKIKFLLLDLCFKRAIFSHAFIFDASQPRPHTLLLDGLKSYLLLASLMPQQEMKILSNEFTE